MPLGEVVHRGWRAVTDRRDRWASNLNENGRRSWLERHAPALAASGRAADVWRHEVPRRFFPGVADRSTAAMLVARFPHVRDAIVESADAALAGRFDLLGYRWLSFGDPIDWQLDPVWHRRAPARHWSLIDPLDPSRVGDSKIVWELNRHQWLVRVAQAYALTGDPKYAAACVHTIDAWRLANPAGMGINWTSSLEVGYRLVSWCWVAALVRDSREMTDQWAEHLWSGLGEHAEYVRRHLSFYFSPNTHLTGEALSLVYAGVLLPELPEAADWRETGLRVLSEASTAQFSDDGVHFEQSTCYQAYSIDIFLHLFLLARVNRLALPDGLDDRVARMVDFLLALRQPDGRVPAIGDDDGGALLPLTSHDCGDQSDLFGRAAVVFERAEFAWAARGAGSEVLWTCGPTGLATLERLPVAPPPADLASRAFTTGGYGVMRSDFSSTAHHLVVDAGPLGCPHSAGHGHADLLSIQCAVFGAPCLVDAGTGCYTPDRVRRDFFRGTRAHSTVRIDGQDQAVPDGPFGWRNRVRARLRSWSSGPELDVLDADHSAYVHLADPVGCRRRVVFVKPEYWLVVDDLTGAAHHSIEVAYQCGHDVDAAALASGWVRATTARGPALWVCAIGPYALTPRIHVGDVDPMRGWVSPAYGQQRPAPCIVFAAELVLPCRIVTVLVPSEEATRPAPGVTTTWDERGCVNGVAVAGQGRPVSITEGRIVLM